MIHIGQAAAFVVAELEHLRQNRLIKTLEDFETAASQAAMLVRHDKTGKQDAVDRLWEIAEASGLIQQYGTDTVQAYLAAGLTAGESNAALDALALAADAKQQAELGLRIIPASQVKSTSIEWLWPDRIAIGKLSLLAGEGGLGKSTLLFDLAARTTRGAAWPDGARGSIPQSVFIMSSEDDMSDTIKPRLQAAGADMDKIFFVAMVHEQGGARRQFSLQADIARLEERIRQAGDVGLVEIDPLTGYLGKAEGNSNGDVRSVLTPLADMAARTRTAVIGNTHFAKSDGRGANQRILGSVGFVNVVRMAFIVTTDANDKSRRLFIPSKPNITAQQPGLAFRIEQTLVEDERGAKTIVATRIVWEPEPVMMTADEALGALRSDGEPGEKTAKADAIEFLRETLADGPKAAGEVIQLAQAMGLTDKPLRAARTELGIKPKRSDQRYGLVWALPGTEV